MAFLRRRGPGARRTDYEWARIPPLPPRVIITDRGTGTLWFLTFSTAESSVDGLGYISITDELPTNAPGDYRTYGPYEGPLLNGNLRLLIRDGYLGYEQIPVPPWGQDQRQFRVMARKGVQRVIREITIPASFHNSPDMIAWQDVDLN